MESDSYMQMFSDCSLSDEGSYGDITARLADHLSANFDDLSAADVATLVQVGGQLFRLHLESQWSRETDRSLRARHLMSVPVARANLPTSQSNHWRKDPTPVSLHSGGACAVSTCIDAANDFYSLALPDLERYAVDQIRAPGFLALNLPRPLPPSLHNGPPHRL